MLNLTEHEETLINGGGGQAVGMCNATFTLDICKGHFSHVSTSIRIVILIVPDTIIRSN